MCTLFISCNNVYEKFVILDTCLFGLERTPPKLILNLWVSLMPLVPTICLFWGSINITVLGIVMLLLTSVKCHCSGCKTACAPSNQYFQLQLIAANGKEP